MLVAPVEAIRDAATGRLAGIRCVRMELGEPDRSGRRRPLPVAGSEFEVPCSFAYSAVGQETDPDLFSREPEMAVPAVRPPRAPSRRTRPRWRAAFPAYSPAATR